VKSHALASFWRCYDELPGHVQRLARKNFELFMQTHDIRSLGFQKKGGVYTVEGSTINHIFRGEHAQSID
jgi:hypothetical protein